MGYTREQIYSAMRAADKAGDAGAVRALTAELQRMDAPQQQSRPPKRGEDGWWKPEPKQRTVGDYVGMGWRAAGEGVASLTGIADALTGRNIVAAVTGAPTGEQQAQATVNALSDYAGLAKPETRGERRGAAIVRGVASTLPTLPFGGGPKAAQIIAGGAGGLSGEIARERGYGPTGQAVASLVGGVGGFTAANALARNGVKVVSPVMQAAERRGVTMLPADVGGTGTRMATGVVRGGTLGEIPIQKAAQASVESARAAVSREAGNIGYTTSERAMAGQAAKRGAQTFIANSEARGEKLFEAIPVKPSRDAVTTNTVTALEDVTRGLQSNPVLSQIWSSNPRLQRTLDALKGVTKDVPTGVLDANGTPITRQVTEGGKVSWADMKALRSTVGKIIGQPSLTSEGPERDALRALYAGLSKDMEATAAASGPKALQSWRRANQFWRGRQDRIENVLSGIIGKSDEDAFRQINSWAQDRNANALARTLRSLPVDEAGSVRATIVERLGLAKPGQQTSEGNVFSPASFVTNWNNLSPKAKAFLFNDPKHRAALDDLALISDHMKRAGIYANKSKTGLTVGGLGSLWQLIVHPVYGAAFLGAQFGLGSLLASPRVAKFLATTRVPTTPGGQAQMQNAIRSIIVHQPELEGALTQLGKTVSQVANDNAVSRVAADQPQEQQKQ